MHARSFQHRISRVIPALSVAALLTVCCSTSTAAVTSSSTKPKLAGKWSGQYSGAYSGTFKLHWTQSGPTLSGSITLSNPGGTYSIKGAVHGNKITFGAVGAGATYTGSVSGKSMSGRYNTPRAAGVGALTRPPDPNWSADDRLAYS
jgi:hypothetical protein